MDGDVLGVAGRAHHIADLGPVAGRQRQLLLVEGARADGARLDDPHGGRGHERLTLATPDLLPQHIGAGRNPFRRQIDGAGVSAVMLSAIVGPFGDQCLAIEAIETHLRLDIDRCPRQGRHFGMQFKQRSGAHIAAAGEGALEVARRRVLEVGGILILALDGLIRLDDRPTDGHSRRKRTVRHRQRPGERLAELSRQQLKVRQLPAAPRLLDGDHQARVAPMGPQHQPAVLRQRTLQPDAQETRALSGQTLRRHRLPATAGILALQQRQSLRPVAQKLQRLPRDEPLRLEQRHLASLPCGNAQRMQTIRDGQTRLHRHRGRPDAAPSLAPGERHAIAVPLAPNRERPKLQPMEVPHAIRPGNLP